jgi:hypothetical protein
VLERVAVKVNIDLKLKHPMSLAPGEVKGLTQELAARVQTKSRATPEVDKSTKKHRESPQEPFNLSSLPQAEAIPTDVPDEDQISRPHCPSLLRLAGDTPASVHNNSYSVGLTGLSAFPSAWARPFGFRV